MPPSAQTNGTYIIPRWFVAFVCFILVAAVPWAFKQSIDTASTKVEMRFISHKLKTMSNEITRRIDRNETRIDRLHELHKNGVAE
jgi:hypothetical protein